MSSESDRPKASKLPRGAATLMIAMLVALLLLSIYANVQNARRNKNESVTLTSPSPTATPQ